MEKNYCVIYIYLLTFNRNEEDYKTDMEKWFPSGGFIVVIRLYIYGSRQIPN